MDLPICLYYIYFTPQYSPFAAAKMIAKQKQNKIKSVNSEFLD